MVMLHSAGIDIQMGARRRRINQRAVLEGSEDPLADAGISIRRSPLVSTRSQQITYVVVCGVCLLILGAAVLKATSTALHPN